MKTYLIVLLSTLGPSMVTAADIYKWVGSDGVVHYADRPSARNGVSTVERITDRQSARPGTTGRDKATGDAASAAGRAEDGFAAFVPMIAEMRPYETTLNDFVDAAADADVSRLLALSAPGDPATRGFEELQAYLTDRVIPFFSGMQRLHNVRQINPAGDERGARVGYWFYTYIVDANAQVRPFAIAVVSGPNGPRVANVLVDRCRPGRHPFCP